jgi:succinyl-CoA synthetase alpha subunit
MYKRYKRSQKERKTAKVINNLREGEGQFKFAVFLSYSSDDEEFVKTNILQQLDENLKLMTGIDRQLVCTGDFNFRPGFHLHDEIDKLIGEASVMAVVVSNNFINSNYSCNEVNQAYRHGIPIVLMFIENVEEGDMAKVPVMKTLFKRNARILWSVENGEPVLKTSWENVSRSILDLIEFKNN